MILLALADIDDLSWQGGRGRADALLALGDMADQVILQATEAWQAAAVFAVRGNHDSAAPFPPPIVDLHLRTAELGGLRFGGLNGCWQYKPRGAFLYYQEEAEAFLESFPAVDVFISHNSPRRVHDREDDVHTGFSALNSYIERAAPRLLLHGHQHRERETLVGATRVIGIYGWSVIEV
ncbi:MAG TPA: metallophosphoesterase [Acidobacteriota bacterium]